MTPSIFSHLSCERSTKSAHFSSISWLRRREQPSAVGVMSIVTFEGLSSPWPAMLCVKATEAVER